MVETDFEVGDKVAWKHKGTDVPGVVQGKSEGNLEANTGGTVTNRAGEPGNPAYVISVDTGGPQDGTEVAKPGTKVHARAPDDTFASVGAESTRPAIDATTSDNPGAVPNTATVEAPEAAKEAVEALGKEEMAADEAAAAGKAKEAALEAKLEAADEAAEGEGKPQKAAVTREDTAEAAKAGGDAAEADGAEVLKRKEADLDAPITRADAAKVAKLGGPATNLRSS